MSSPDLNDRIGSHLDIVRRSLSLWQAETLSFLGSQTVRKINVILVYQLLAFDHGPRDKSIKYINKLFWVYNFHSQSGSCLSFVPAHEVCLVLYFCEWACVDSSIFLPSLGTTFVNLHTVVCGCSLPFLRVASALPQLLKFNLKEEILRERKDAKVAWVFHVARLKIDP